MNLCFLIGHIVENIDYKFILNGTNDAIAKFRIKLLDDTQINIIAYDKNADYCYRALEKNIKVLINGFLRNNINCKKNTKIDIIVNYVYKI